jgi:hypothetical protein
MTVFIVVIEDVSIVVCTPTRQEWLVRLGGTAIANRLLVQTNTDDPALAAKSSVSSCSVY